MKSLKQGKLYRHPDLHYPLMFIKEKIIPLPGLFGFDGDQEYVPHVKYMYFLYLKEIKMVNCWNDNEINRFKEVIL